MTRQLMRSTKSTPRYLSPFRGLVARNGIELQGAFAFLPAQESRAMIVLMEIRKIVHIDMDAFYASVEQRDNPELRGKPVVVAWKGNRSVVCAASYEARKFGVRSAMPATRAERLCPDAIFIPPDFTRYRAVSKLTREIFKRHADLVEPLSLDEAYLDVTENKTGLPTATRVASAIRMQIRLSASAGIAPNKFLAKLASDWSQARRTICNSTRRGGWISPRVAGWPSTWSRQSDRCEAGETRSKDSKGIAQY